MFSSIQAGCGAAEGDPILILPGDMPFRTEETVAAFRRDAARCHRQAHVPVASRPPHRVAGPVRREILKADPRSTLATILRRHADDIADLQVDDPGVKRRRYETRSLTMPTDLYARMVGGGGTSVRRATVVRTMAARHRSWAPGSSTEATSAARRARRRRMPKPTRFAAREVL
jgi:hypothetical protein